MRPPSSARRFATRTALALLVVPIIAAAAMVAAAAPPPSNPVPVDPGEITYGLTNDNTLLRFDTGDPGRFTAQVPVVGLAPAESLLSIDFRPATGELIALSNGSRLYRVDPVTGMASAIGSAGRFTLSGQSYGFDLDPVTDDALVMSDTGQNLAIDADSGDPVVAVGAVAPMFGPGDVNEGRTPHLVGTGHISSFPGSPATFAYDLDAATGSVVMAVPTNPGRLATIGPLGVTLSGPTGFDIHHEAGSDVAFASISETGEQSSLYTVDLTTGAATLVGPIGPLAGQIVRSLAVTPVPTAIADGYAVPSSSRLSVAAPGVRANDVVAAGGDPAEAKLTVAPKNGTVTLGSDGAFTYKPAPGYVGGDTFGYALESARGIGPTSMVMIAVSGAGTTPAPVAGVTAIPAAPPAPPVNTAPTPPGATAPATSATPGTVPSSTTVPGSTTAPDSTSTTAPGAAASTTTAPAASSTTVGSSTTIPASGATTTPAAGQVVAAQDDSYVAAEFTPLQIDAPGILANDQTAGSPTVRVTRDVAQGTLTLEPDGGFTYFPRFGFSSGTDSFTYEVTNGTDTASAQVTFQIQPFSDTSGLGPTYDLNGLLARYGRGIGDPSSNGSAGSGSAGFGFGDSSGSSDLPRTGSDVLQLLALGLALIVTGTLALQRTRSRHLPT